METVEFAVKSETGSRHETNEDAHLADGGLGLFAVCDGLGGHSAGEVASGLAARTLHEHVRTNQERIEAYTRDRDDAGRFDVLELLEEATQLASNRIFSMASVEPEKRGMGTTLVGALVVGTQAFVVHVGDSRLYLLREGKIEQVTEDHNAYNDLVKRRGMPLEKVRARYRPNAITRSVGVQEYVEPDTLMLDLIDGDRLLLCTDGVARAFDDDVAELVRLLSVQAPERSSAGLVKTARERGSVDDATALVVEVRAAGERRSSRADKIVRARALLTKIPLFHRLEEREQLHILQLLQVVKTAAGQIVIEEGTPGDCLYIVLKGDFRLTRKGQPIRTLVPGEHVGEMALIRNRPRTATVTSATDGELLRLGRENLHAVLRKKHRMAVKILWAMARTLAARLEAAQESLDVVPLFDQDTSSELGRPF